jgi:hypothetical protein
MTGWRLRAVASEAMANLGSAQMRTVLTGILIASTLGALTWAELAFSADVKRRAEEFAAAGGYIAVVGGPAGIDASRCERLRERDWVLSVGSATGAGVVSVASAPGIAFARFTGSRGIVEVWDPRAPVEADSRGGYVVGAAAADELGLITGSYIRVGAEGPARVTVIDPANRNEFAMRGFLDVVPASGRADQCWVEVEPGQLTPALAALPALLGAEEAEARPVIDRGEFGVDPAQLLDGRLQRWAWLLIAGIGIATMALMSLFRRSESAVYRAFGLSRTGLLLMVQLETLVLVVGSYLIACSLALLIYGLAFGPPDFDQIALALRSSGMAAAAIVAVGPLMASAAGRGSPAALLKER